MAGFLEEINFSEGLDAFGAYKDIHGGPQHLNSPSAAIRSFAKYALLGTPLLVQTAISLPNNSRFVTIITYYNLTTSD